MNFKPSSILDTVLVKPLGTIGQGIETGVSQVGHGIHQVGQGIGHGIHQVGQGVGKGVTHVGKSMQSLTVTAPTTTTAGVAHDKSRRPNQQAAAASEQFERQLGRAKSQRLRQLLIGGEDSSDINSGGRAHHYYTLDDLSASDDVSALTGFWPTERNLEPDDDVPSELRHDPNHDHSKTADATEHHQNSMSSIRHYLSAEASMGTIAALQQAAAAKVGGTIQNRRFSLNSTNPQDTDLDPDWSLQEMQQQQSLSPSLQKLFRAVSSLRQEQKIKAAELNKLLEYKNSLVTLRLESDNDMATVIAMKQVLKIEADRERVREAIASLGEICRALLNHATTTSKQRASVNKNNNNNKHDDDELITTYGFLIESILSTPTMEVSLHTNEEILNEAKTRFQATAMLKHCDPSTDETNEQPSSKFSSS